MDNDEQKPKAKCDLLITNTTNTRLPDLSGNDRERVEVRLATVGYHLLFVWSFLCGLFLACWDENLDVYRRELQLVSACGTVGAEFSLDILEIC